MSVCVAALAADSRAIVCVADKALSYGDEYIQWDADTSKMMRLCNNGLLMVADNGNGPRVQAKFHGLQLEGYRTDIIRQCEFAYQGATGDLIEAAVLRPRLLDRSTYLKSITGPTINEMLSGLADEIKAFDVACDLLVCGFDAVSQSYILDLRSPGIANDLTVVGFHSVGAGWGRAISRLLFCGSKRSHPIERALYEAFDAKANAEMSPGLGSSWDAQVVVSGKAPIEVPGRIKHIIEQVWFCKEQSPFDPNSDLGDNDMPPKTWKNILKRFSAECLQ